MGNKLASNLGNSRTDPAFPALLLLLPSLRIAPATVT